MTMDDEVYVFVAAATVFITPVIYVALTMFYANKEVIPTEQILAKTDDEEEEYSVGEFEGNDCAVCLNNVGKGETYWIVGECKHGFHLECIRHWLHQHSTCPLCRAHVTSNNIPNATTTTSGYHYTSPHDLLNLMMTNIVNWMASPLDQHLSSSSGSSDLFCLY